MLIFTFFDAQTLDAEFFRQAFSAPVHHDVVVPLEQWARDGREKVHPGLRRRDVPVVAHAGRVAVLRQLPAPLARQLADGLALDDGHRLDAREPHTEGEPVRELALPRVALDAADTFRVARLDLLDALDAAPPGGPLLRAVDQIPNVGERRAEAPEGHEAAICHDAFNGSEKFKSNG